MLQVRCVLVDEMCRVGQELQCFLGREMSIDGDRKRFETMIFSVVKAKKEPRVPGLQLLYRVVAVQELPTPHDSQLTRRHLFSASR